MIATLWKHRAKAEAPHWEEFDLDEIPVHDWRRYVTATVRSQWQTLSLEARCCVVGVCQHAADQEEWD